MIKNEITWSQIGIIYLFIFAIGIGVFWLNILRAEKNCKIQAKSMGFQSEFEWYAIGGKFCTFILPNGTRVLSSKYRVVE